MYLYFFFKIYRLIIKKTYNIKILLFFSFFYFLLLYPGLHNTKKNPLIFQFIADVCKEKIYTYIYGENNFITIS